MESTLFTELSVQEESSLSGGFADTNLALNLNVLGNNVNQNAIANSGDDNRFITRQRNRQRIRF